MTFDLTQRNRFGAEATSSNGKMLIRAFERRGCSVETMGRIFRVSHRGAICFVHASDTSFTSTLATKIWKNKLMSRKLLRQEGISVPHTRAFGPGEEGQALRFAERQGNAVVKPIDGIKGKGVSIGVTAANFDGAWKAARQVSPGKILVERCFEGGQEARYLVLDNRCIGVAFRFPPQVRGDGVSTIAELVATENRTRVAHNPSRADSPILIDRHRLHLLAEAGLSPETILERDRVQVLDPKAGLSTGGHCCEAAAMAHPGFKALAERIAACVPGSHVLGIDVIARDHTVAPTSENHVVLEANTLPGLRTHMYPDYGTPNDVAIAIADSCLNKMGVAVDRDPATVAIQ